jgi:hypothetical protein
MAEEGAPAEVRAEEDSPVVAEVVLGDPVVPMEMGEVPMALAVTGLAVMGLAVMGLDAMVLEVILVAVILVAVELPVVAVRVAEGAEHLAGAEVILCLHLQ